VQVGTPDEVYHRPVDEWAARMTGPVSVLTVAGERVLVRPEWATLDGHRTGTVLSVRFRGPHSDYLLRTDAGALLVRHPGPPRHRRGDRVGWSLHRWWPAGPVLRPRTDAAAGPVSGPAASPDPGEGSPRSRSAGAGT